MNPKQETNFEISSDEVKDFFNKMLDFGRDSRYSPDQFAVLVSAFGKYLRDQQGISIEKKSYVVNWWKIFTNTN